MDLLEQLVFNGNATKDFERGDGKLKFTLATVTGENQLNLESGMEKIKGSPNFIIHTYGVKLLSYSLKKYQEKDFSKSTPEEVENFIITLSTPVVDVLSIAQADFQKECKNLLSPEVIENLSETPSTDSD